MEKARYLVFLLALCFLGGMVGYQPVIADTSVGEPEEVVLDESEDDEENVSDDDVSEDEDEAEDEDNDGEDDNQEEEKKELIIFAVSAGGSNNTGELIELLRLSDNPLLLTDLVISYENKSGTVKTVYEFSEGTILSGESLLLRFSNEENAKGADLFYFSPNLAQDGGKVSILVSGEEIDSVCWGTFPDCNGPKKFSSNPRTTLVRDLETMEFSHFKDYEPEWEEGREVLILPETEEEKEEEEEEEEIKTPVCQGLVFSEVLSYYEEDRAEQFIELFNPTTKEIKLDGCALRYKNKLYELSGVVKKGYLAIYPKELGFALTKNPTSSNLIELVDVDGSVVDSLVFYNGQKKGVSFARFPAEKGEEDEWRQTYIVTPNEENILQETKKVEDIEETETPEEMKKPVCKGLQFSELFSFYETEKSEQFIEFFNPTSENINLDGCFLRYKNKLYALQGEVLADDYFVYLPVFSLTKNPVNSNLIEIIDADGSVVDSLVYYNGQKKGVAFAQFGYLKDGSEQWLQTYEPTPGEENSYQKYKTCPVGKVINEETGNCVKATSLSTELAPCPEGYYRNPVTNRCKKYATKTSALKECAEGYELNPLTNRCRKIVNNDGAEYEVREENFEEKSSFMAVWAIVAVGVLGALYILFEYRKELVGLVRRK